MRLFLPFLLLCLSWSSGALGTYGDRGSSGRYGSDRYTGSTSNFSQREKEYKITVKFDQNSELGDPFETIRDLSRDVKELQVMVQELNHEVRRLGGNVGGGSGGNSFSEAENFLNSSFGRGRTTPDYRPRPESTWEVPKINCAELRLSGQRRSGVYTIHPVGAATAFEAFCDMTTDGGGWTVVQRRGVLNVPKSVRENFYRSWREYEVGFGSLRSDYWLGLEKIHSLTQECNNELIVNITGWDNTSKFARYGRFNISGRLDFYRLSVANYTGNAGDGLLQHNKMKFSTYDKQNDMNGDENCAELYQGAWWYKDCFWSNLNGEYASDGSNGVMSTRRGIEWGSRHFYSYMKTEMKIRPKC